MFLFSPQETEVDMPRRPVKIENEESSQPLGIEEAEKAETLARLAGAIAHPIRVQLLLWLMDRPDSIYAEMAQAFGHSQSIVRQHLKMMRESGIVRGVIHGNQLRYSINPEPLTEFKALVAGLSRMKLAIPSEIQEIEGKQND